MLKLKQGKKIAILDEQENAVVKIENTLRITHVYTDYLKREVRVILHRGIINDNNTFTITNNEPIIISIQDEPEKEKLVIEDPVGAPVKAIIPARPLFTLLITPQKGHGQRWVGDFRQKDIEDLIVEYQLIPEEIEEIINQ